MAACEVPKSQQQVTRGTNGSIQARGEPRSTDGLSCRCKFCEWRLPPNHGFPAIASCANCRIRARRVQATRSGRATWTGTTCGDHTGDGGNVPGVSGRFIRRPTGHWRQQPKQPVPGNGAFQLSPDCRASGAAANCRCCASGIQATHLGQKQLRQDQMATIISASGGLRARLPVRGQAADLQLAPSSHMKLAGQD